MSVRIILSYLTVLEKVVELGAVTLEILQVEELRKDILHNGDVGTNSDLSTKALLQVLSTGHMVGMDMGLKNPVNSQTVLLDVGNNLETN